MSRRYSAGDRFPDLTVSTVDRPDRQVGELLHGLTVFWVLRYVGCPFCQLDLVMLKAAYDRIRAQGAQVFVVMQSDKVHIRAALEQESFPFEIVCDGQQRFYRALGIDPAENEEAFRGDAQRLAEKIAMVDAKGFRHGDYEGDELQLPAIFVVGEDGIIQYAHYAEDVLDMPAADELPGLLAQLRRE